MKRVLIWWVAVSAAGCLVMAAGCASHPVSAPPGATSPAVSGGPGAAGAPTASGTQGASGMPAAGGAPGTAGVPEDRGPQGATWQAGAPTNAAGQPMIFLPDPSSDELPARLMAMSPTLSSGHNIKMMFGVMDGPSSQLPLPDVTVTSATINTAAMDHGDTALTVTAASKDYPKGIYALNGVFGKAGKWVMTVTFQQGGRTHVAKFPLDVQ